MNRYMEQVMKKRISALLMALMLAVGMLSGCDNTSINSSDSGKNGSLCNVLLIYTRAFNKNCPGRISGNDLLCISHNCE